MQSERFTEEFKVWWFSVHEAYWREQFPETFTCVSCTIFDTYTIMQLKYKTLQNKNSLQNKNLSKNKIIIIVMYPLVFPAK